jgi:uncharacterized protein (DUF433 family)
MSTSARITVNKNQMAGVPCIRGLRIPVATIRRLLVSGIPESKILEEYPDLQREDLQACRVPATPTP